MRHRAEGKKFHRIRGERRAFLRSLAANLIRKGHIETTDVRAKAIRPVVERFVTLAKKQNLASRRVLLSRLHDQRAVRQLCDEIAPRYGGRHGGYLRIKKLGTHRKRDGSSLSVIEFV
jgi:large subunit ribosomal protein L17